MLESVVEKRFFTLEQTYFSQAISLKYLYKTNRNKSCIYEFTCLFTYVYPYILAMNEQHVKQTTNLISGI